MAANKASTSIPKGYTFLNHECFVSTLGKEMFRDLSKKAYDRNPDEHDMYIYNDFYAYGCLDLVDKTLSTVNAKIAKKGFEDAYFLLEGLALWNDFEGSWPMCDDGKRTKKTDKAYGALVVATLRGLEEEGKLDLQHLPNLESFLKVTVRWADQMRGQSCPASYGPYCKRLGAEIVKNKTSEYIEQERAWLTEWIAELEAEDQAEVREEMKEQEEERAADKKAPKPWYANAGNVDEDNLVLSRVWKDYKAYLATVPKGPMRGPSWDISKWPASLKQEFSFDNEEDFD
ncbi:hypothetical protein H0H93_000035 [Arthromyces matolae]|nr:hypothetical protein H0H93_000035 [Arthromyces matolae]